MAAAQPLLRRKLRRRGVAEPGYLEAVEERFGRYVEAVAPASGPRVWIHAVSLGETRAAGVLIAALRERLPGVQLLLTHGTATGRAEGLKWMVPGDLQAWLPWDTTGAVGRFLTHFRPDAGLLMETEVWPNLAAGCRAAGVPLVLANARLSDKSLQSAQRLGLLARPAFAALAAVWAQSEADAQRLRELGAPVSAVFGNLKFDMAPNPVQLEAGRRWRRASGRPVVLLASSREGEEALWLEAVRAYPPIGPAVQWLIVPRHPQRFDEVARLLQDGGLQVSRRSAWNDVGPDDAPPPCDVWLGDSLGEMALYYSLADAALLGGSFGMTGGQNLIEAAACGCPVVMGPSTYNFAEASALAEAAAAAIRVADMGQGVQMASALVAEPARLGITRGAALSFAGAHRGAAARTADALCALLVAKAG
ncbi:3-deoxy-D-manno-octulosonic acid transferase [Xylophilus rhododendri]|uniref:3-deoxy-D-manno-octulosonic acid transferase n=1 Tax=Xylophilus rhododendri TaxID=2697032 RepID=A0A857JE60_9BURK|nr:3-deoxy-D-manno-octulosonic acid transferase [Xylophilus rhododendri]QHJ01400.1 3-deoxy-D-manno-octulosonic acid transferase [Xylophilus rhododendri]